MQESLRHLGQLTPVVVCERGPALPPSSMASSACCSSTRDDRVTCWGANDYGQLGNGKLGSPSFAAHPSIVDGVQDVVQVSSGGHGTCAWSKDGSTRCWGDDEWGGLGIDPNTQGSLLTTPTLMGW